MTSHPLVPKGFALVLREEAGQLELLIFDHPLTPPQLPKGTIDPGEEPLAGALRELAEETGLVAVECLAALPPFDIHDDFEDEVSPSQRWHAYVLTPTAAVPDAWIHKVQGNGGDAGMEFGCRFAALGAIEEDLHPLFHRLTAQLRKALARDPELSRALRESGTLGQSDGRRDAGQSDL